MVKNLILFIRMFADALFEGIAEALGTIFLFACIAVLIYAVILIIAFLSQPKMRIELYKKNKYVKEIVDFLVRH